jgi:4-oxalocrotonate tautomerase
MPHIIVKLWPGHSDEQKNRLTEQIVKDIMDILGSGKDKISVAIQDIKPEDWSEQVYKPDIVDNSDKLYKKPGYSM